MTRRAGGIFWYEAIDGTEDLSVNVSWTAGEDPRPGSGWGVGELPGAERVAVWTYNGDLPGIGRAWHAFMVALDAAGCEPVGPSREVYLIADGPQTEWVTELQQPVVNDQAFGCCAERMSVVFGLSLRSRSVFCGESAVCIE